MSAVGALRTADQLLRGDGRFAPGAEQVPWRPLATLALGAGVVYGLAMGSFGLRPEQALYSATKVPLLLAATTLLCLPSFFVVNLLLGLGRDFPSALKAVLASQGTVALALAGFAPVTVFWYGSSADYGAAVAWNGGVFLAAAIAGQVTLARHYAALVARDPRHGRARNAWLVLYAFVATQMAWVLRPFVGNPEQAPSFFREGALGNAYVEVARLVGRVFF